MEQALILKNRKLTWFLLFIGFCCLFGWLATNFILMAHFTSWRHFASVSATLQTFLMSLTCTSFFAVLGTGVFVWAHRRLKRTEHKKGLVIKSLVPAAFLTPLLGIAGILTIIMTPFVFATARTILFGHKVVQSADSPDGRYQAYVIDAPSIDGPNHHLNVKEIATGKIAFVAQLPEDVDYNQQILWSPYSDIVVFRTHFKLIAYAPAANQTQEVILGGEYHWRNNGTFWVDYNDVKKPKDFQFPQAGIFSYRLEDSEEPLTLTFKDLQTL